MLVLVFDVSPFSKGFEGCGTFLHGGVGFFRIRYASSHNVAERDSDIDIDSDTETETQRKRGRAGERARGRKIHKEGAR